MNSEASKILFATHKSNRNQTKKPKSKNTSKKNSSWLGLSEFSTLRPAEVEQGPRHPRGKCGQLSQEKLTYTIIIIIIIKAGQTLGSVLRLNVTAGK